MSGATQERRASDDAATPAPGPRRTSGTATPWIVATVVLTALAAALFVLWFRADQAASTDREVAQVAGRAMTALTNWEADDLDAVRQAVEDLATDRFREEAGQLLDEIGSDLAQADARSTGELLDVTGRVTGDGQAVAMAVLRQEIDNADLDATDVQCWGVRASLAHVNGEWLVDGLELYGPNQCPQDVADDAADTDE